MKDKAENKINKADHEEGVRLIKEREEKWQKFWADLAYDIEAKNESDKPKKYVLVEFPYPSGSGLHVGHAFSFTGGDVFARFNRMKGFNVLFPMGWDAFGLPTENYAIKTKQKPQKVTKDNTDMFRSQMKRLAFSFDWSREVNTTDPEYYKWTQWIFVQLFKKGLAYKQEMPINWCPSCKIGLANEEVVDGKCERCGETVERRNISQWIVKITEYADKLLEGLKNTDFIDKVKAAQINWIGKSEGVRLRFKVNGLDKELEVFTTRPDTLFGATFMVIAPEHELVSKILAGEIKIWTQNVGPIEAYVKQTKGKSDLERTELAKDKTGVFSGLYAINPVTGREIPIWISDFVLANYGTGAIMSVPAHDDRDEAFAKKFGLEIIRVIDDEGKMINSEFLNGFCKDEAVEKIIKWLREKGIGEATASFHLRDWIFSRQHYWGEPIPMINCRKCGWMAEKEENLPVVLPEVDNYEPTDDGKSPLSQMTDWVKTVCPVCGEEAVRETDTMPNWAGSDWYYMRYTDPLNDIEIASKELLKKWLPVDVYIGGDEHNTLHLLYSRFIYLFLKDIGAVPSDIAEPYFRRLSHGVILGPDNQRMSKSHGNVIVPDVVADKYGADTVRMYLMFMGPFDATMAWNENTLMGVKRFLDRWEKFIGFQMSGGKVEESEEKVKIVVNKLIKAVGDDFQNFKFNTAIAKLMEAINEMSRFEDGQAAAGNAKVRISVEDVKKLIKLMAPLAPYTAEEQWSQVRSENEPMSVHAALWPEYEEKYLKEERIMIPVAVNGKVREQMSVDRSEVADNKIILEKAKKLEKIKTWIEGKEIVKEIYIPGKMVNIVIK